MAELDAPGLSALARASPSPPKRLAKSSPSNDIEGWHAPAPQRDAHEPQRTSPPRMTKLPSLSALFGQNGATSVLSNDSPSGSPTFAPPRPHQSSSIRDTRSTPGSSPTHLRMPLYPPSHGSGQGSNASSISASTSSPSQATSFTTVDDPNTSWGHGSGSSYRGSIDDGFGTTFLSNVFSTSPASHQPSPTSSIPQPLLKPFLSAASPVAGPSSGRVAYAPPKSAQTRYMSGFPMPPSPRVPVPTSPIASLSEPRRGSMFGLGFGDFDLLETLGTGTFGRVMLVRCRRDNRYFAMKVLQKSEVVRLSQVEHINSERGILNCVQHPGVVKLFCTFQDERNLYMLLEFVQGGELFSHLRRAGRFTPDVARFYAANIILALEHMHSKDIVYRDLKPENLLLDHLGYVKLTDLGFSKYVPDRTFTLCGTPSFLSPEIITGTGHGKPADWWAFGVLLFEMLCGYPPFFDDNPIVIYEQIMAGRVPFPPHVEPIAKDLIKDLSRRLGNLRGGVADIKRHPWFEGVSWQAVAYRQIAAPIIPRTSSASDTVHFERWPATQLESLPGFARAAAAREGDPQLYSAVLSPQMDEHAHLFLAF